MAKRIIEKMSEGKKNIIAGLIQEYDIKTAEDIQEALKDLLGGTIQEMMEAELDEHLGYEEYERSDNTDYRNGVKHKTLRSSYGEISIDVPQDRNGDFDPQIVPKRRKDISAIKKNIIAMSAKGMTTRQISDIVEDIYGFEVSESMVTAVTDKILPQIEEWQQRPLSAVYPIVFIDAIHFSVREEHVVKKIAEYIILGINDEGKKEVLSITVGKNESAKYWLGVLNDLKNRGVEDIMCRRSFRHKRIHCCSVPGYRISALYCSSGAKHLKVCCFVTGAKYMENCQSCITADSDGTNFPTFSRVKLTPSKRGRP